MRNKLIFVFAIAGILAGLMGAYVFGIQRKPQPPAFNPASNPYEKGIYASGIVETYQKSGQNINVYPEVAGTVTSIPVAEGQHVGAGATLFRMEDSVPRASAEQQQAQAESARAQIDLAQASLKSVQDQLDKQIASNRLDPRSVSKDSLDTAKNALAVAQANLEVARRQYQALSKAALAARALLAKYEVKSAVEGTILSVNTAVGSYVSPQGTFDSYTGGATPPVVMGNVQSDLGVRCYIDEILIQRLPSPERMNARMFIRGTDLSIPLTFVRIQPYVSPKIELSNQRTERVDVRVLPVIFRFERQPDRAIFPGQLVDVYIGEPPTAPQK